MKTKTKLIFACMILVNCLELSAQSSSIKVGANFNATYYTSSTIEKINFPSFDVAFEKAIAKKWSFSTSFSYAVRKYETNTTGYQHTNYDKILILEGRYYFNSNNVGPFLQLGVPLYLTTQKVHYYDGTTTTYTGQTSKFNVNVFAGVGLKYPFGENWGAEINVNIAPPFEFVDDYYGIGGIIRSGAKVIYTFNKNKAKK